MTIKLQFGKYKGMPLTEVPTKYLRDNKNKFSKLYGRTPEVVESIQKEIDNRNRNEIKSLRHNAKKLKARKIKNKMAKRSRRRNKQ